MTVKIGIAVETAKQAARRDLENAEACFAALAKEDA